MIQEARQKVICESFVKNVFKFILISYLGGPKHLYLLFFCVLGAFKYSPRCVLINGLACGGGGRGHNLVAVCARTGALLVAGVLI